MTNNITARIAELKEKQIQDENDAEQVFSLTDVEKLLFENFALRRELYNVKLHELNAEMDSLVASVYNRLELTVGEFEIKFDVQRSTIVARKKRKTRDE